MHLTEKHLRDIEEEARKQIQRDDFRKAVERRVIAIRDRSPSIVELMIDFIKYTRKYKYGKH